MPAELLSVALVWILYFFLHSFFATNYCKELYFKAFPKRRTNRYRLIYNLLAILYLFPVMHFQITSISFYVFKPSRTYLYSGLALVIISFILFVLAFRNYSAMEFLGISKPSPANSKLNTKGFNRIVRHPIYFATFVMFIGFFVCFPTYSTLTAVACIIAYLIVGSFLEERRLIKEFGDEYLHYKKEVPMLIPFLKLKHK